MTNWTVEPPPASGTPLPRTDTVVRLDPFRVIAGGPSARLEDDVVADAALRRAIKRHGQLVPILVRPYPDRPGFHQIIAGRRRVLALRDIGGPVLALVRPLDDLGSVLAQGQENTARRDLSFIEKAHLADQMVKAGYSRSVICEALSVNKGTVALTGSFGQVQAFEVDHAT